MPLQAEATWCRPRSSSSPIACRSQAAGWPQPSPQGGRRHQPVHDVVPPGRAAWRSDRAPARRVRRPGRAAPAARRARRRRRPGIPRFQNATSAPAALASASAPAPSAPGHDAEQRPVPPGHGRGGEPVPAAVPDPGPARGKRRADVVADDAGGHPGFAPGGDQHRRIARCDLLCAHRGGLRGVGLAQRREYAGLGRERHGLDPAHPQPPGRALAGQGGIQRAAEVGVQRQCVGQLQVEYRGRGHRTALECEPPGLGQNARPALLEHLDRAELVHRADPAHHQAVVGGDLTCALERGGGLRGVAHPLAAADHGERLAGGLGGAALQHRRLGAGQRLAGQIERTVGVADVDGAPGRDRGGPAAERRIVRTARRARVPGPPAATARSARSASESASAIRRQTSALRAGVAATWSSSPSSRSATGMSRSQLPLSVCTRVSVSSMSASIGSLAGPVRLSTSRALVSEAAALVSAPLCSERRPASSSSAAALAGLAGRLVQLGCQLAPAAWGVGVRCLDRGGGTGGVPGAQRRQQARHDRVPGQASAGT